MALGCDAFLQHFIAFWGGCGVTSGRSDEILLGGGIAAHGGKGGRSSGIANVDSWGENCVCPTRGLLRCTAWRLSSALEVTTQIWGVLVGCLWSTSEILRSRSFLFSPPTDR